MLLQADSGRRAIKELVDGLKNSLWPRSYFNWRQDTSSDLQLFAVLSALLVVFGGFIKSTIISQVCPLDCDRPCRRPRVAVRCVIFLLLLHSMSTRLVHNPRSRKVCTVCSAVQQDFGFPVAPLWTAHR